MVAGTAAVVAGLHGQGAAPGTSHVTLTDSPNWVGYTFSVRDVTGVRADWTEPLVRPAEPRAAESVWLGVGG